MTRHTVALRAQALLFARQDVEARTADWKACAPGTPAEVEAVWMLRVALRTEAAAAEYYIDALADLRVKP